MHVSQFWKRKITIGVEKVTSTLQTPVENMELRTSYCNEKGLNGNFQKCTTCVSMTYVAFLHTMYTHIRAMMFDCWGHRCCPCQLIRTPTCWMSCFVPESSHELTFKCLKNSMYDLCTQFLQFLTMSEIHILIFHCIDTSIWTRIWNYFSSVQLIKKTLWVSFAYGHSWQL